MAHLLVIDDDQAVCRVFVRFLTENGFTVDCAPNGSVGLDLLERNRPDLVITDIMMPEKDGLEVVIAMRHTHPEIPVIAISGGMQTVSMDMLPMVEKLGARKVFYKPVELSKLLQAVQDLLK